mmetsp:Transcript_6438/g.18210  ORF Transcript_6438/g.18210 Transcript_6438/m.18210 type:complete len:207 (+) Transcript_6438:91-711(+)
MTMAEAPPPPLQMEAQPRVASFCRSTLMRPPTMRPPLMPMGCPSATAPPLTLTLSCSSPRMRMLASATTEKASLISWYSTSFAVTPALANASGTASAGAVVKSTASFSASAKPRIFASGASPRALAAAPLMTTVAKAPSLRLEALAAVTVPSRLKAGRSAGIFSGFVEYTSLSWSTTTASPRRCGTETGTISSLKSPASIAAAARR